jgi:hypothetical protein
MNKVLVVRPSPTWHQLRSIVSADDTALATFDYDSWPSSNVFNILTKLGQVQNLRIAFFGTNAADEDFTYILYGRQKDGPIQHLISGQVTFGSRVITKHPITKAVATKYWADTITAAAGLLTDSDVLLDAAGNDRIGQLEIPARNVEELYLEVDLDGGSTTAASAEAIISGY